MTSRRLRLLNILLRWGVGPRLRATREPEQGARDFALGARGFKVAPLACVLERPAAAVPLTHVTLGRPEPGKALLYLHGGAYFAGSPTTHRGLLTQLARLSRLEVVAPDYRLLQQAPFPAAFDDCLAAFDRLESLGLKPDDIILGGDSAGGGLALALLSHLCAEGRRPAGLFGLSPWTDLTLCGASLTANAATDPLLPAERLPEVVERYLAGAAPDDPRASPLFASFTAPPPVWLAVGASEILRDDTLRMAERLRALGGEVEVTVVPDVPHVWPIFDGWIPEARTTLAQVARFSRGCLGLARVADPVLRAHNPAQAGLAAAAR